ncbi:hypothetical protein K438DRAFT_1789439 [Mycena galopus ATCC 62051]|nr:hypothetical protein K438DRAFT_1789439 [Mycena galopus ATCC 62051]
MCRKSAENGVQDGKFNPPAEKNSQQNVGQDGKIDPAEDWSCCRKFVESSQQNKVLDGKIDPAAENPQVSSGSGPSVANLRRFLSNLRCWTGTLIYLHKIHMKIDPAAENPQLSCPPSVGNPEGISTTIGPRIGKFYLLQKIPKICRCAPGDLQLSTRISVGPLSSGRESKPKSSRYLCNFQPNLLAISSEIGTGCRMGKIVCRVVTDDQRIYPDLMQQTQFPYFGPNFTAKFGVVCRIFPSCTYFCSQLSAEELPSFSGFTAQSLQQAQFPHSRPNFSANHLRLSRSLLNLLRWAGFFRPASDFSINCCGCAANGLQLISKFPGFSLMVVREWMVKISREVHPIPNLPNHGLP